MKLYFTLIFLQLLVISARSDDKCKICPGQPPQESPCNCDDLYYHLPTKTCVPLFVCRLSENWADLSPLSTNRELTTALSNLMTRLITMDSEKIPAAVSKVWSKLQSQNSTFSLRPKEVSLLRKVVGRNFRETVIKTLPKMKVLFNPYILSNSKLTKRCNGSRFCIIASVFGNDTKRMENFVAGLIPDWIDDINSTIEGVAEAEKEQCAEGECPLVRFFSNHRSLLESLLRHWKADNHQIARGMVKTFSEFEKIDGFIPQWSGGNKKEPQSAS